MTTELAFRVLGLPAPQGSKRHVGNGRMVEQSRAVGPWREAVRGETQRAMAERDGAPDGLSAGAPVQVEILFMLPRPKTAPRRVLFPAKRPDIDKLARAVLDGLVAGGALADDGQVVDLIVYKRFAPASPGCVIFIRDPQTAAQEES